MASPPPPILHCPVCRIAMVGSKSHESHPHFDVFSCLACDAVVRFAPPPQPNPKPDK